MSAAIRPHFCFERAKQSKMQTTKNPKIDVKKKVPMFCSQRSAVQVLGTSGHRHFWIIPHRTAITHDRASLLRPGLTTDPIMPRYDPVSDDGEGDLGYHGGGRGSQIPS